MDMPVLDLPKVLENLIATLLETMAIRNWTIFEESSGGVTVKLRLVDSHDSAPRDINLPKVTSFRRKSVKQLARDVDRLETHRVTTRSQAVKATAAEKEKPREDTFTLESPTMDLSVVSLDSSKHDSQPPPSPTGSGQLLLETNSAIAEQEQPAKCDSPTVLVAIADLDSNVDIRHCTRKTPMDTSHVNSRGSRSENASVNSKGKLIRDCLQCRCKHWTRKAARNSPTTLYKCNLCPDQPPLCRRCYLDLGRHSNHEQYMHQIPYE